jgi:hypothetical protein
MRAIIVAIAVIVVSVIDVAPGHAQSRAQYNRCAQLASQQGHSAKSTKGRRFINRCVQRGAYRGPRRESPRCPSRDDPFARSAYPSWMCP